MKSFDYLRAFTEDCRIKGKRLGAVPRPVACRCGEPEAAHNNLDGCRTRDGAWCHGYRPAEEDMP